MKTKEAISFLSSIGWKVDTISPNKYRVWRKGSGIVAAGKDKEFWTGRQIIRLAKFWNFGGSVNKNTKIEDNSKNRSATRDALKTENFDRIPQKGKVKSGDRWNWD